MDSWQFYSYFCRIPQRISIGNSMICSDNIDNFEISRVVFMPNITTNHDIIILFILLPAKGLLFSHVGISN